MNINNATPSDNYGFSRPDKLVYDHENMRVKIGRNRYEKATKSVNGSHKTTKAVVKHK